MQQWRTEKSILLAVWHLKKNVYWVCFVPCFVFIDVFVNVIKIGYGNTKVNGNNHKTPTVITVTMTAGKHPFTSLKQAEDKIMKSFLGM